MRWHIASYDGFQAAVDELCAFLLEREIPQGKIFDSRLVVHELVGNALQHAQGGASVCAEIEGEHILLSVRGATGYRPPQTGTCPPCFAERGRGFFLVDSVSTERTCAEDGTIFVRIRIK